MSSKSVRDFSHSIDYFVNSGIVNPLFIKTLNLAFTRGWSYEQTMQFLAAVSIPRGPVQWQLLGHPEPERCRTLATALTALAVRVKADVVTSDVTPMTCGSLPDLRVYAVLHAPLAVAFTDVVNVIGSAMSAERLRWFADMMRSASMVG